MKKVLNFCLVLVLINTLYAKEQVQKNTGDQEILQKAKHYETTGDLLKAKDTYTIVLTKNKDNKEVAKAIESVNIKLLLTGYPRNDFTSYTVKSGDSIVAIANKHNIPQEFILEVNDIKSPKDLQLGKIILIPNFAANLRIKVDVNKNILYLYKNTELIKEYSVSSGAGESPSPIGTFTIYNRIVNPTWTLNGRNVPGGTPQNPLGSRWMGFKEKTQYGIHGTNEPENIGKKVSKGCIRMHNKDVEELFKIISIGTKIEIL